MVRYLPSWIVRLEQRGRRRSMPEVHSPSTWCPSRARRRAQRSVIVGLERSWMRVRATRVGPGSLGKDKQAAHEQAARHLRRVCLYAPAWTSTLAGSGAPRARPARSPGTKASPLPAVGHAVKARPTRTLYERKLEGAPVQQAAAAQGCCMPSPSATVLVARTSLRYYEWNMLRLELAPYVKLDGGRALGCFAPCPNTSWTQTPARESVISVGWRPATCAFNRSVFGRARCRRLDRGLLRILAPRSGPRAAPAVGDHSVMTPRRGGTDRMKQERRRNGSSAGRARGGCVG
jgi:hypothetical protein